MEPNRRCDGCTACCDGWLHGTAHGKPFFPGRRCHFVGERGCSIYNDRPEFPCKVHRCPWLADDVFPEWLKPSVSGTLLNYAEWGDGQVYIEAYETGKVIDPVVLNWLIQYSLNNGVNLAVQVNRGWYYYGSFDFIKSKSGG